MNLSRSIAFGNGHACVLVVERWSSRVELHGDPVGAMDFIDLNLVVPLEL